MTFNQLLELFKVSEIMLFVEAFFIINITFIGIEIIIDFFRSRKRDWDDSVGNIIIFLINSLLDKTLFGAIGFICLLPFYYYLSPVAIPMNGWTWLLSVFVADFTYYWMHRIEHKHRILWGNHSVHHSSKDYNLTVSLRLSFIEGAIEWIFLIPMVIVGFNPFQAIISLVFVAQFQTWIHTEHIGKLGILDEFLNTPSLHRVHHGSNKKYLDKNYGGILMIWDRLFGTFQREEEKVIYGLTKDINSNNPITINFIEYKRIYEDVRQCKGIADKLKIIFGNLTWKPTYFKRRKL
jgi:sterol desaturase/sphingolipid hydroxylase (fatty acid hydroxylase superfamily)